MKNIVQFCFFIILLFLFRQQTYTENYPENELSGQKQLKIYIFDSSPDGDGVGYSTYLFLKKYPQVQVKYILHPKKEEFTKILSEPIDLLQISGCHMDEDEISLKCEFMLPGICRVLNSIKVNKIRNTKIPNKCIIFHIPNECVSSSETCSSARQVAKKFLSIGASAYLGGMKEVSYDELAEKYVLNIYEKLLSGKTLGEAVKYADKKADKEAEDFLKQNEIYSHSYTPQEVSLKGQVEIFGNANVKLAK